MTVRKLPDGRCIYECYPADRDKRRIRKKFTTKAQAIAFENYVTNKTMDKIWLGEKQNRRLLSQLIEQWYALHRMTLADSKQMMAKLNIICNGLNNLIAADLTTADFVHYRELRLKRKIKDDNVTYLPAVKPRTVNIEKRNLSAVFGTLKRLGYGSMPNSREGLPTFKVAERSLTLLYPEQIKTLLTECECSTNKELSIIAKICLSTGVSWREAEGLEGNQITPHHITYTKTKSKKNRTEPISQELYNEIPKHNGQLFTLCRKGFKRAFTQADIQLPEGQPTYDLRHTFASHFMMNGGTILVLKDIFGHSDIKMTMVYAHFAPEHLEYALNKNPLINLK